MTHIRIPADLDAIARALDFNQLLVAREWQRAAIVYAFTEVGGPRNSAHHTPEPPKVNIRQFARLGIVGLTTTKAVLRYRRSWSWAMRTQGVPAVNPGDEVELPDALAFPGWDEVMTEYVELDQDVDETEQFQARNGLMVSLYGAARALDKCYGWARALVLDEEERMTALDAILALEARIEMLREQLKGDPSDGG